MNRLFDNFSLSVSNLRVSSNARWWLYCLWIKMFGNTFDAVKKNCPSKITKQDVILLIWWVVRWTKVVNTRETADVDLRKIIYNKITSTKNIMAKTMKKRGYFLETYLILTWVTILHINFEINSPTPNYQCCLQVSKTVSVLLLFNYAATLSRVEESDLFLQSWWFQNLHKFFK